MGDVAKMLLFTRNVRDITLTVVDNNLGTPLPAAPGSGGRKRRAGSAPRSRSAAPAAAAVLHRSSRSDEGVIAGPVVGGQQSQVRRSVVTSQSWRPLGAAAGEDSRPKRQKTVNGGSGGAARGSSDGSAGGSGEGLEEGEGVAEVSRRVWSVVGNGKADVAVLLEDLDLESSSGVQRPPGQVYCCMPIPITRTKLSVHINGEIPISRSGQRIVVVYQTLV